jgi:hypothetical protein
MILEFAFIKWFALILLVYSYAFGTVISLAEAIKMAALEFGLLIPGNHYYNLYLLFKILFKL